MEAVIDNRSFIKGFEKTKEDIYEELQSRMNRTVLNVMKNYLRENNVEFNGSSIDLDEFKKNVVSKLPKTQQLTLTKLENDITRELSEMIKALHDGSQTAFSEVAEKLGGFGKSVTKMFARGTAMSVAYTLNPTLAGAAMAGTIAIPAIVKGVKTFKDKQEESRQASLDAFLLKLTASYDENTKQISYNIPQNIMNTVAENLKTEGIIIDTKNEVQFIRDVAGLEIEKKELAVKAINNLKGSPLDFDKEITDIKTKIKNAGEVLKKDVISPLSTAAMIGLNVGNSLATWDPDISASVITTLATGVATGNFATAAGVGAAQLGASKAVQFLPDAVGDVVQNVNEIETMAGVTGLALGGALILKVAPTLIKHGVIAAKNFIISKKQDKDRANALSKQEKDELGKKIDDSIKLTAQTIQGKSSREVALGIIADTLRSKGIEIDNSIATKEELKKYTQSLSKEDKKDVLEVANVLEQVENSKEGQLKSTLSGLAKTAYWGGVIALAGLGAYDVFLNPGFIEGLVVRDSIKGQQAQATFQEQVAGVKDVIADIPKKIKNIPKTLKEIYKDPKGYIENRKRLRENAKQIKEEALEENGASVTDSSTITEDSLRGKAELARARTEQPKIRAEEIARKRIEAAKRERSEKIAEMRETLPSGKDQYEQKLIKAWDDTNRNYSRYASPVINSSANDVIIGELNLKTEEGLLEFLRSFGENNETIQQMMKDAKVKTIEDLAHYKYVQESIDTLGGVDYYKHGFIDISFFKKTDYSTELAKLINQRGREVLGNIPSQSATDEEIEKFLMGFFDKDGNIIEDKLNLYSAFQEGNTIYNNSKTISGSFKEFLERMSRNRKVIENPDGVIEGVMESARQNANQRIENGMEKIAEDIGKKGQEIQAAKQGEEFIRETEEGFLEGLNSRMVSDPKRIAAAGATIGVGIGAVQATKKGLLGRFGDFIRSRFRNKHKTLPEGTENIKNTEQNDNSQQIQNEEKNGDGEAKKESEVREYIKQNTKNTAHKDINKKTLNKIDDVKDDEEER